MGVRNKTGGPIGTTMGKSKQTDIHENISKNLLKVGAGQVRGVQFVQKYNEKKTNIIPGKEGGEKNHNGSFKKAISGISGVDKRNKKWEKAISGTVRRRTKGGLGGRTGLL